jgi:hypothetical protein
VGHDERGAGQIMSSILFQKIVVFIVLMLLAAGLYKTLIYSSSDWSEKIGFESVKTSMQRGLTQMHWQWQYEGRPLSIVYKTGQSQSFERLAMNNKGWPALGQSRKACSDFLNMFAGEVLLDVSTLPANTELAEQLGIEIEYIAGQEAENDSGQRAKRNDVCRYTRPGQQFEYQLGTGNLF